MFPCGRKLKIWVLGSCVFLALSACGNKREVEKSRSEIDRAVSLIDQAQYSEAIYILESNLETEPGNARARLLLGSAYAGRAGLRFLDFKHFATQVQSWGSQPEPQLFGGKNKVLQSIVKVIWQIQRFSQAFDTVPEPAARAGFDDLRSSLEVLDGAGRLEGGPALYRALIRVVLFKHDVNDRYGLIPIGGCGIDLPQLVKWFTEVGSELELMLADYAYSLHDPEAQARTLKMVASIRRTAADGQALLSGVRGGPEANLIQQALLKGSTCAP